jgi:aldehyde:ferredoxin oxidoreductase
MNGYAGKILKLDLTHRKVSTIPTGKYEQWVGGHGMGSAIFFDLVKDKTIDGLDPANIVTMMTSPFSGTLVPGASARTEVQGIGVQSYPIGWFTRSNFGGRFSAMLKFAGWDGIVIMGKSDSPVWIDIRNDKVSIRDCNPLSLWGKDTRETQQIIWDYIAGEDQYGDWLNPTGEEEKRTTQHPAVVTIGPAGENMSRQACLIHDSACAAGQGGFGAVWGSKNLKAISVIGTGQIKVNDPKSLIATRLWQKKNYAFDLDELDFKGAGWRFTGPPYPVEGRRGSSDIKKRPKACVGCHSGCRARYEDGLANESTCIGAMFYMNAKTKEIRRKACELLNLFGLNAAEMIYGLLYLYWINAYGEDEEENVKIPDCPLDFNDYGSEKFVQQFVKMVAYGNDGKGNPSQYGKDIANGFVRAAKKWGRLDMDLASGILHFPYWGLPLHKEPRAQVYWGYGTLLGDRDINEHEFDWIKWDVNSTNSMGLAPSIEAEELVKIMTNVMVPFRGDLHMLDFSDKNIYSESMAKLVSWHRYYTRFWKQSMLCCDVRWPDIVNVRAPGNIGSTGVAEPRYYKAVTGKDLSFEDGVNLGRKIWNLDQAIWTLQGRHRDMVHFCDNVYKNKIPLTTADVPNCHLPGFEKGKWGYHGYSRRKLDRVKFDEFKTRFYKLQGWDPDSGFPTRSNLRSLGLDHVANELEENGKLGKG